MFRLLVSFEMQLLHYFGIVKVTPAQKHEPSSAAKGSIYNSRYLVSFTRLGSKLRHIDLSLRTNSGILKIHKMYATMSIGRFFSVEDE